MTKAKKTEQLEAQLNELTADLQRTRADFENYRKRVETEKLAAREAGASATILKLLPIIDTLERATAHIPEELKKDAWVGGIAGVVKQLEKLLSELKLERVAIVAGETEFDPEVHEAISADESEGEHEIVAEELQAGYRLDGIVIRHAMVRVTRR